MDSFLSGNNTLEILDISCLYPAPVDREWHYREERGEHLGADSLSREMPDLGRSFNQLVLSVSTCSQPLCITTDSTIPYANHSILDPVARFARTTRLHKEFKTTGPSMISQMAQLCEVYEKSRYADPAKGESFTWGITKCLTPISDIRKLDMRDYTTIKNGIIFSSQSEALQTLVQKIKMFVCINEAMDGRIISHDMLEYEGTLSPKGIPVPLKEVDPREVQAVQPVKSFASSCIDCDEARFNRENLEGVLDLRSKIMKKLMSGAVRDTQIDLSHSSMDSDEAGNAAHLIGDLIDVRQVNLSNNSIAYMGVIAHFMGRQVVILNIE